MTLSLPLGCSPEAGRSSEEQDEGTAPCPPPLPCRGRPRIPIPDLLAPKPTAGQEATCTPGAQERRGGWWGPVTGRHLTLEAVIRRRVAGVSRRGGLVSL